jgi:hypothetical protein
MPAQHKTNSRRLLLVAVLALAAAGAIAADGLISRARTKQ